MIEAAARLEGRADTTAALAKEPRDQRRDEHIGRFLKRVLFYLRSGTVPPPIPRAPRSGPH